MDWTRHSVYGLLQGLLIPLLFLTGCTAFRAGDGEMILRHNQAMEDYRAGNLETALAGFESVLAVDAEFPQAYLGSGMVHTEMGLYERAVSDFSRAIELDPGLAAAYSERGWARAALTEYTEAIVDYNRAIELGVQSAAVYTNRGIARYQSGQLSEAGEDLKHALSLEPDFTPALKALLQVMHDLQDYSEVLRIGSDLIASGREDTRVYMAYGDALLAAGDLQGATEVFQKAVDLEPGSTPALRRYSRSLCDQGFYAEGLQIHNRLVELHHDEPEVYLARADCLENASQWPEALEDYLRALELDQGAAAAASGAGRVYGNQRNYDLAEEYLELSLDIEPLASTCNSLGLVYRERNHYDLAVTQFQEGRLLDPENAVVAANLALAAFMAGDIDLARAAAGEAETLDPGLVEIPKVLGLLAYQEGDYETAERYFSEALRASEDDPYVEFYAGAVLYQLSRYDDALAHLQNALDLDQELLSAHAMMALVYQALGIREQAVIQCRLYLKPDMDPTLMFGGGLYNVAGQAQKICNQLLGY